uniref:hypothetical protein n=1 Tax=Cocconeiopsis kantsiensis TaxID=3082010 RepID=UPI003001CB00
MKNLNNKQIIKINALKFKKNTSNDYFSKTNNQIKFRFITQKRLFNTRSIYKNVLEYFSVILEDDKRFYAYFKKRFPKSFKYLPIVKFVTFLFIFTTLKIDYETYSALYSSMLEEKSLILEPTKFYSHYSFGFYFVIIIYEFVLSVYVTLKASHPAINSLEGDDNNNDTEESSTSIIKKSPRKRHHSEPLPRKSNRPVIQRRNTR